MVEIEDIRDANTLSEWLDQIIAQKGKDDGWRIAVVIANRAAMRTLPVFWRWTLRLHNAHDCDLTTMLVFRAALISEAAGIWPVQEIREAAVATSKAARVGREARVAARAIRDKAAFAADAADASADVGASATAARTIKSAWTVAYAADTAANTAAMWDEIRLDAFASQEPLADPRPLWFGVNPLADVWAEVNYVTQSAPEGPTHWSFWRRWYEDALKGGPLRNPELLKAIALIDPEDWEKGPGFIHDVKIPELQAEHARHIASTAAEIVWDHATRKFKEVAVSDLEDGLFRDARERTEEAIADFRTFIDRPQSPYGAFEEDLDLIEMQLARAADRPIRCYENLADAMLVILDIAQYNGLEKDGRVTRLVREFERSRRDLRADDEKIAAREAKRIRIGYDELMDAEQADFRAMLTDFAHKSDDVLEAEMVEDEAAIADRETLEGVRDRALLRSSERIVQMDGIERDEVTKAKPSLEDVGKKADAMNKVAKAGETGAKIMAKIVEWFLTGGT